MSSAQVMKIGSIICVLFKVTSACVDQPFLFFSGNITNMQQAPS